MGLLKHSTPAERERGCILAHGFGSASEITEEGGALVGAPTFNKGVVLDGTTDLVSFNNVMGKINFPTLSLVIRFIPEFAYDENVQRTLLDTTNGARYRIVKQANGSNNVLSVVLGGTTVADIASAAYSAAWLVGEENVLVISGTTGDTSVWLNGTQILTDDATAWSAVDPTEIYFGAKFDSSGLFYGEILEFKAFSKQLTDQESLDISNNAVYNYINETAADIPMDMANHDPTNLRSLDVSGNDYHMGWGTGSVATRPTKNTKTPGYVFDGGDFMVISSGLGITDYPFTMSCMFRNTGPGISTMIDLADSADGARNSALYINTSQQVSIAMRNGGGWGVAGTIPGDQGEWIHVVGVYLNATSRSIYINGRLDGTNTNNIAFYTPDRFTIGRLGDLTPSSFLTGEIAKVKVWTKAITPMQVADLKIRDYNDFNEV